MGCFSLRSKGEAMCKSSINSRITLNYIQSTPEIEELLIDASMMIHIIRYTEKMLIDLIIYDTIRGNICSC